MPARKRAAGKPRVARVIALVLVLLIVAGVAWALRPKPVEVAMADAVRRPMQVTVESDAVTRVRSRFTVSAPVSGMVQRILLREGDVVRAGQPVALIATPPTHPTERRAAEARLDAARAAQQQATAMVAQASAAYAQAERDASRVRQLAAAGALAPRDVENASVNVTSRQTDLEAARARVRVAAADLGQARALLDAASATGSAATTVRAPGPGRILRIPEQSARVVAAGTPIVEIGDPASLEVAADVLSSDAALMRAGQRVTLTGWGGAPLHGIVRLVEPSARTRISALGVEEQRLIVVIDLVDAPAALGDGYRLDASTTVWDRPQVLAVPASALLREGTRWEVFAVRDGRARRQPVQVGHLGGGFAEVLGGLNDGERVVVFPPDNLRDGARVTPAP